MFIHKQVRRNDREVTERMRERERERETTREREREICYVDIETLMLEEKDA